MGGWRGVVVEGAVAVLGRTCWATREGRERLEGFVVLVKLYWAGRCGRWGGCFHVP